MLRLKCYGLFCLFNYLSIVPQSLSLAFACTCVRKNSGHNQLVLEYIYLKITSDKEHFITCSHKMGIRHIQHGIYNYIYTAKYDPEEITEMCFIINKIFCVLGYHINRIGNIHLINYYPQS